MLHERRLATLFIIVVLLNPSQINSERHRRTRDNNNGDLLAAMVRRAVRHSDEEKLKNNAATAFEHAQKHHLHERQLQEKPIIHHAEEPGQENEEHDGSGIEDESGPEREREIHVEVSDSHLQEDGEQDEDHSGDDSPVDVRDIHYHIQKSDLPVETKLKVRKHIDAEEDYGEIEFSGEDGGREELDIHHKETRDFNNHQPTDDEDAAKAKWEHFQMQLHSHGKEGLEFGYITDEEEADNEDNDAELPSGERDYDHEHIKTLHVHRGVKNVKHARDGHVEGRNKKEIAGEMDGDKQSEDEFSDERDLQTDSELEEGEASQLSEDEEDLSGAEYLPDVKAITQDNDGNEDSEEENATKDSGGGGEENTPDDKIEDLDSKTENETGDGEKIPEDSSEDSDSKAKGEKNANRRDKPNKKRKNRKNHINRTQKILQNHKPSSGKKGSVSIGKQGTQNSQKLKVHAEIDLTQEKSQVSPSGKITKKTKSRPSYAYKGRKHQKARDAQSRTETDGDVNSGEDFYIDENDEPKERSIPVEMRDIDERIEDREPTYAENRKIKKGAQTYDKEAENVQEFRRGNSRHLLQFTNERDPSNIFPAIPTHCTHPLLPDEIKEDTIVYIRAECRLCLCKQSHLVCDPKPNRCDQHLARPCIMAKGQLADGERHSDGCNNCICRNGELLCTRLRCLSSNFNYTNYQTKFGKKDTSENFSMVILNEGLARGKDSCMECDTDPVSPVCGPNWKTYRSMCHAIECGGFRVDDVKLGKCESLHFCGDVMCGEREICVADNRGPCLANTTRDGTRIECPQHECVFVRENCSAVPVEKICGEDHKIYTSKCAMFTNGVPLAYYGPCKTECLKTDGEMCGVDGVTFKSTCHAAVHNSYIDYPGQCGDVDPKYNIGLNSKSFEGYFNPRCKTVAEMARCAAVDCQNYVIPEGSCCPVCGTAISIRLDTAVRDMTVSANVQPPQDLNRVDAIFTELKNLSDQFGGLNKCQLTADLVDTHDISVVFKPIESQDFDACKQVAATIVAFINSPAKSDLEPAKAMLAAAVLKDRSPVTFLPRAESMVAKRRKKRRQHHSHEPFFNVSEFNEGHRIRLQRNLLLFLAFLSLYWSTNLIQF